MKPRLLIVDPSMHTPEDEGVATLAGAFGGEVTVLHPALRGNGPGPDTPHDWDGVVVLGSAASVHDDWPWLQRLRSWVHPLVTGALPTPLLGICFGHQLVAHEALDQAADAVGFLRPDHEKDVGIVESRISGSRLVGDLAVRTLISHREEVKRRPPGFQTVGHRDGVLHDALEHESLPILTVQFHPEARAGFAQNRGLDVAGVDERLRTTTVALLRSFLAVVERSGASL
ncbi:MAG: hypothetical protein AMXMBFR64_38610 [Myxococcales bacterium]